MIIYFKYLNYFCFIHIINSFIKIISNFSFSRVIFIYERIFLFFKIIFFLINIYFLYFTYIILQHGGKLCNLDYLLHQDLSKKNFFFEKKLKLNFH